MFELQSYISSALFAMENPPVKLAKLAMGNPALGSNAAFKTLPSVRLAINHLSLRRIVLIPSLAVESSQDLPSNHRL